ncbi:MAG: GNAT family N-acetyltransferase [Hyphomonadaceae bacterium]
MADLVITREEGPTGGRYVGRLEGVAEEAELAWSRVNAHLIIADHTSVPDTMRGQGVALKLATRLVEDARTLDFKIIPLCPYVNAERKKHPDWADVFQATD